MIDAYKYDPETNELIGRRRIARRRLSRKEPDKLLVIGPYTTTEPPRKREKHRTPVWDRKNGRWSVVPDYRHAEVWSKTTKERVHLELGDELSPDHTLDDPNRGHGGEAGHGAQPS